MMSLKTLQVASYFASFIVLGLIIGVIGPTLHGLADNVHTNVQNLAIIFTARGSGGLITAFTAGILMDKFPGHWVLGGAVLLIAVAACLVPLMPSVFSMVALFFCMGMLFGAVNTCGNGLCAWADPENAAFNLNFINGAFGIGTFFAPFAALASEQYTNSVNYAYYFLAIIAVGASLIVFITPSPVFSTNEGRQVTSLPSAKDTPVNIGITTPLAGPVDPHLFEEEKPKEMSPSDTRVEPTPFMLVLVVLYILIITGMENTFGSWLYTYSIGRPGFNSTKSDLLTAAFWISFTLARFAMAIIVKYCSIVKVLYWEMFLCLLASVALVAFQESDLVMWISTIAYGVGVSGCFANCIATAQSYFYLTGKLNGLFSFGSNSGDMTIPLLVSSLMGPDNSRLGVSAIGYTLVALTFVALIILFTFILVSDMQRKLSFNRLDA